MKTLLAIIEQGGYPDFTSIYESLGYNVITAASMRKAITLLKNHRPDVITAEFIYSPMYSARISNLESLFASLQSHQLTPQLIIFVVHEIQHHMDRLETGIFDIQRLIYPINEQNLLDCFHLNTSPG